jgi:DNA replication factor GINS
MNLDDLRRVKNRERETDSLQELPDSFYADVAEYIRESKQRREALAAEVDDPFSNEEISRLSDEIDTAEQVAESLYERRVGKVVKQASFAAADMGTGERDNLTAEEQDLFGDLVERITDNKRRVLDVIAGEADAVPTDAGSGATSERESRDAEPAEPSSGETADPSASVSAADLMGEGDPDAAADDAPADATESDRSDEPETDGSGPTADRRTVRITRDVGEIFGVDERTYTLESDDVVTLPSENAAPLVERDAAEPLE